MTTAVATGTDQLLAERDRHVLVLTLNRPDRLNAISGPMLHALSEQLVQANRDPDVRVVVLTGAGRGFCSGLDLVDQAARGGDADTPRRGWQPFDLHDAPPIVLYRMDKPVVCALNGAAAGYGMDLALLCDIRIAGESGRIAPVMVKRGVVPESGGSWLLPRLVGWAKASEILFRGRVLPSDECLALGLVSRVVPDDRLMATALEWAHEIAENAPLAVQATKRMMRLGLDETYETTVDHLAVYLSPLFASDDFKEGVASFLERRPPQFTGR